MKADGVLGTLRRCWPIAMAGLTVGAVAAVLLVLLSPKSYSAKGTFYAAVVASSDSTSAIFNSEPFVEQRARSWAAIASSQAFATHVRQSLGESKDSKKPSFTATFTPDTALISFSATDSTPEGALRAADALAIALPEKVRQLDGTHGVVPVQLKVSSAPLLPTSASSPQPVRDIGAGLVLGALLGGCLAVLSERIAGRGLQAMRPRWANPDETHYRHDDTPLIRTPSVEGDGIWPAGA